MAPPIDCETPVSDNPYFFVMPSFVSGWARVLDIGATYDNGSYLLSSTPAEADARSFRVDWIAVRRDLMAAMEANGKEEPQASAA